jgi:hypothetical protein
MFQRTQQKQPVPRPEPQPQPTSRPSVIHLLQKVREGKFNELVKLNAEVIELDTQIGWLERFPQVERIIESLRGS